MAYSSATTSPESTKAPKTDAEPDSVCAFQKSLQAHHPETLLDHATMMPTPLSSSPMSVLEENLPPQWSNQLTTAAIQHDTINVTDTREHVVLQQPLELQSIMFSVPDGQSISPTSQGQHCTAGTILQTPSMKGPKDLIAAQPDADDVGKEEKLLASVLSQTDRDKELLSPTESELQEERFEFHSDLPDIIQTERFENCGLRRALKQVSPKLSRKEQWYAWRKAKALSESPTGTAETVMKGTTGIAEDSGADRMGAAVSRMARKEPDDDWDWVRTELEPMMNDDDATRSFQSRRADARADNTGTKTLSVGFGEGKIQPVPQRSLDRQRIKTLIEQRHGSDQSQASVAMEISPEDMFWSYRTAGSCNLDNVQADAFPSFQSDQTEYQKDHRGFFTRPAQQEIPSRGRTPPHGSHKTQPASPFQIHEDDADTVTTPLHTVPGDSSPISTPGHMTPVNHSPLRRPDTPHPIDETILTSVEKTRAPRHDMRHSTPAYEDRSPSPSPISQMNNNSDTDTDTDMPDLPHSPSPSTDPRFRSARQASPAPSTFTELARTMLPPPSPFKSRSSSPIVRAYGPASPSVLRSPAIARVLIESQSLYPQTETPYPFPLRRGSPSPSPSPGPSGSYSPTHHRGPGGWTWLQQQKPDVAAAPTSASADGQEGLAPSSPLAEPPIAAASSSSSTTTAHHLHTQLPSLPTPPPIPDDPDPKQLKLSKRAHRKSTAVQDPGARVGKLRSVTATASTSTSTGTNTATSATKSANSGAVKGKRNVTAAAAKAKRRRAVTHGLDTKTGSGSDAVIGTSTSTNTMEKSEALPPVPLTIHTPGRATAHGRQDLGWHLADNISGFGNVNHNNKHSHAQRTLHTNPSIGIVGTSTDANNATSGDEAAAAAAAAFIDPRFASVCCDGVVYPSAASRNYARAQAPRPEDRGVRRSQRIARKRISNVSQ